MKKHENWRAQIMSGSDRYNILHDHWSWFKFDHRRQRSLCYRENLLEMGAKLSGSLAALPTKSKNDKTARFDIDNDVGQQEEIKDSKGTWKLTIWLLAWKLL